MADTKVSALAALTGANSADGDLATVVDVSDTTMAASGTNKSISVAELAKAIGLNGRLILDGTEPTAPADGVALFERTIAGRHLPAFIGPSDIPSSLQPFLARSAIAYFRAYPAAATITGFGLTITGTGTATAVNLATTTLSTMVAAVEFAVTTAATTAVAGYRCASATGGLPLWRGNAADLGGFTHIARFRPMRAWPSTQRAFIGVSGGTGAPTDVNPSSQTSIIGVGLDAADTNWQVMHNDGTGTATKVDTGIARATGDDKLYEVAIYCKPNDTQVFVTFTDVVAGTSFSTTITTDLPANTTQLGPRGYRSVGGTSSTIGLGLVSLYTETDN